MTRAEASCTRLRRVLQADDAVWRYLLQHQAVGYTGVELARPEGATWKEAIRFAIDLPTRLVCVSSTAKVSHTSAKPNVIAQT